MDDKTIMKFRDEDGNPVELEVVARIYLEDKEYLILAPLVDGEDEFVFRVDQDKDGAEVFNALESDAEFMEVKKEYARLLYDAKGAGND